MTLQVVERGGKDRANRPGIELSCRACFVEKSIELVCEFGVTRFNARAVHMAEAFVI